MERERREGWGLTTWQARERGGEASTDHCLLFCASHVRPSFSPSPVVATQGCTYLSRKVSKRERERERERERDRERLAMRECAHNAGVFPFHEHSYTSSLSHAPVALTQHVQAKLIRNLLWRQGCPNSERGMLHSLLPSLYPTFKQTVHPHPHPHTTHPPAHTRTPAHTPRTRTHTHAHTHTSAHRL
jgi:hypothetical protein